MFADIYEPDGTPYKGDPRWVLKKNLKKASDLAIPSMLAQSWNILAGYAGQVSLGHAAFFGLGAITTRFLWVLGYPFFLAFLMGGVVAVIFAKMQKLDHLPGSILSAVAEHQLIPDLIEGGRQSGNGDPARGSGWFRFD
jgi:hypothetical protein